MRAAMCVPSWRSGGVAGRAARPACVSLPQRENLWHSALHRTRI